MAYTDIKFKNYTFFSNGEITEQKVIGHYYTNPTDCRYNHVRYEFNTGDLSGTKCSIGCDADKTADTSLEVYSWQSTAPLNNEFKLYYTISTDPNEYCNIQNNPPANKALFNINQKYFGIELQLYYLTPAEALNFNLYPQTTYYLWIFPEVTRESIDLAMDWPGSWHADDPKDSKAVQISIGGDLQYTIDYNLNGGTGSGFASQAGLIGTSVTLHTTVPTRQGFLFQGWATTPYGKPIYQPGEAYTGIHSIMLYASWAPIVSYERYIPYIYAGGQTVRCKTQINAKDLQQFQEYIPLIEIRAVYANIGSENKSIFVFTNDELFDLRFQIQKTDHSTQSISSQVIIEDLITGKEKYNKTVQNISIPSSGIFTSSKIQYTDMTCGIFKMTVKVYVGSTEVASTTEIFCRIKAPNEPQLMSGMNLHIPNDNSIAAKLVNMAAKTGMSIWRISIPWASVEKTKHQYEIPTLALNAIDHAINLGVTPLIILAYGNDLYGETDPHNDTWRTAYANYCNYVVSALASKQVKYFEVWNEWNANMGKVPNIGHRDGASYAKVLCDAYTAIKQANPNAKVVGGAVAGAVEEWINDMFAYEEKFIFDYMDIFSFHTYPLQSINGDVTAFVDPDAYDYTAELEKIRTLMDNYHDIIPIWLTETGWPTHIGTEYGYQGVSEEQQAAYLIQLYAKMLQVKDEYSIQNICWYDMMNDGTDKMNPQDNFGMLYSYFESSATLRYTPKPSYIAFGALNAILEKINNGTVVDILWDNTETTVRLRSNNETVWDMYGNPITETEIQLTYKPIYVIHN